jgi:hypothetical protein
MTEKPTHPKVIIFQFSGGGRDGQTARSDRPENAGETDELWRLSLNGMVGRRFDVKGSNNLPSHRYQVRSKYEDSREVIVTCHHVGGN